MDITGIEQPKQAPTGLKRPYSADATEQRHRSQISSVNEAKSLNLKEVIGFTAPRDRTDADYILLSRPETHKEIPTNIALKQYQTVVSGNGGHTMTNSTSIVLPKHWFGSGTHSR